MEIRKLEIRRLKEEELAHALKLIWEVFEKNIKPSYTQEGVDEFLRFINYNFIKEVYDKGEMIFWGAFEEELIGTVAVRPDGHICLFFVKDEYQGMGIGKALFQMMYNYCVEELHVKKITVNAAPQSVAKYIHMGMRQLGNLEERNGILSVPMEMYASPTLVKPVEFRKKKDRKKLWMALTVLFVLLIGGAVFCGIRIVRNLYEFTMEEETIREIPFDNRDDGGFGAGSDKGSGSSDGISGTSDELSGVDAIPVYEGENLPYEIKNDAYSFVDDEKINTVIDFNVQYPQITITDETKLDAEIVEKINQTIYTEAIKTVEEIYNAPSDEIKETVLHEQTPVLVSYVTYKVTYSSENFISIVMEDQSYKGSQEEYYYDFRTLNVSLEDGSICEVKDLVDVNDDFVKDWLMLMRSEAENSELLSELNKEELTKALSGESFEGVYDVEYFFDKEGVEIGFAFDYEEGDENDTGYAWVTAPFSFEEIEKFKTDSPIWHEIN